MKSANLRARYAIGMAVGAALAAPATSLAQDAAAEDLDPGLEQIVVTAQRRTQSLQDVPVSIGVMSGDEIQRQGFRNLDEMADFTPSVSVDAADTLGQSRKIRGFGTTGNALTLEQSVPIFVDGIHYGRPSQVKSGFMDVERVEILKGPQPLYFGMNAIAGAISIVSRAPTPEWEGYVDVEAGNHSNIQWEAAVGGPLTDTLGIRLAGIYEDDPGFLKDVVTGAKLPGYKNKGGRITLQWEPTDKFDATFKFEGSEIDKGPEAAVICLRPGSMIFLLEDPTRPTDEGNVRSVWADPPKGEGWEVPHDPLGDDCYDSRQGISAGGPYFAPPLNVAEPNSITGALDVREAADYWTKQFVGNERGVAGFEVINTYTTYLDLNYVFDNGIQVNSKTGYNDYYREYVRDNTRTPFLMNIQNRKEDLNQWSTELRFTSPETGRVAWMAGVFMQKLNSDMFSNGPRANVRRGVRYNELYEDQEWKSAFAMVTFNFLDDRFSIDLGARYTDLDKQGGIKGWGAQWVYDVVPCAPTPDDDIGGGNFDPATCPIHPDAVRVDPADTTFLLQGADTSNLWALEWEASRETPSSWRSPRAHAIGLTALDMSLRNGPYDENFSLERVDPQVTLRYRLTPNHSFFARYAESFKAGGFDTGTNTINKTVEDFRFEKETAWSAEVGVKGELWDRRARYDLTLFNTEFQDLQIAIPTGLILDESINANAGGQRVRGAEFSTTVLVNERLTVNLGGALMEGKWTFFPFAGCTFAERKFFEESGCDPETGRQDKTGEDVDGVPDWKFVLGANYSIPVLGSYQLDFDAKGYISDDPGVGFHETDILGTHGDLNLLIGFGPQDGTWSISAWGRNLLEPSPTYHPENDLLPEGFQSVLVTSSDFASYGVTFRYNYR